MAVTAPLWTGGVTLGWYSKSVLVAEPRAKASPWAFPQELRGRDTCERTGRRRGTGPATAAVHSTSTGPGGRGGSVFRVLPNGTGSGLCLSSINSPLAQSASPKPGCQEL